MAIGEICSREVVFTLRETTVRACARLMREFHVGDLIVVDEVNGTRVPVGIVTDRDIVVGIVAKGLDADTLTAGEIITQALITAPDTAGVSETIELMRAKGVRRVPVVNATGALVGIVTADDMLDLLAEEMSALAGMVAREQRREAQARKV